MDKLRRAALMRAFDASVRDAERQRKSDDICSFIVANWRLFARSRRIVDDLVEELSQLADLTPTALCEALGVPSSVLFKKVKVTDTADAVLHFQGSALLKSFEKALETSGEREIVVFFVAGKHSMCITNMPCARLKDTLNMTYDKTGADHTYSLFPYGEAMQRLACFQHLTEGE